MSRLSKQLKIFLKTCITFSSYIVPYLLILLVLLLMITILSLEIFSRESYINPLLGREQINNDFLSHMITSLELLFVADWSKLMNRCSFYHGSGSSIFFITQAFVYKYFLENCLISYFIFFYSNHYWQYIKEDSAKIYLTFEKTAAEKKQIIKNHFINHDSLKKLEKDEINPFQINAPKIANFLMINKAKRAFTSNLRKIKSSDAGRGEELSRGDSIPDSVFNESPLGNYSRQVSPIKRTEKAFDTPPATPKPSPEEPLSTSVQETSPIHLIRVSEARLERSESDHQPSSNSISSQNHNKLKESFRKVGDLKNNSFPLKPIRQPITVSAREILEENIPTSERNLETEANEPLNGTNPTLKPEASTINKPDLNSPDFRRKKNKILPVATRKVLDLPKPRLITQQRTTVLSGKVKAVGATAHFWAASSMRYTTWLNYFTKLSCLRISIFFSALSLCLVILTSRQSVCSRSVSFYLITTLSWITNLYFAFEVFSLVATGSSSAGQNSLCCASTSSGQFVCRSCASGEWCRPWLTRQTSSTCSD